VPITSLPNLLTLSRILAIPVVIATFYVPGDYARWFACALFSAAGVTDWLDGHMARRWEQQSEIGRFLDPIADKLLVSAILFMLTAFGRLSAEALLPALVILCREILVSGLREYLAGLRVGMPVSRLAKWKTVIQMVAIGVLIVGAWLATSHLLMLGAIVVMVAVNAADRVALAVVLGRALHVGWRDLGLLRDVGKLAVAAGLAGLATAGAHALVADGRPVIVLATSAAAFGAAYLLAVVLLGVPTADERAAVAARVGDLLRRCGVRPGRLGVGCVRGEESR